MMIYGCSAADRVYRLRQQQATLDEALGFNGQLYEGYKRRIVYARETRF